MDRPYAVYESPDIPSKKFTVVPGNPRYETTDGVTTRPSDHVLNAGQIDRDKPSEPKREADGSEQFTKLSQLRMNLTGLQDDINEFLTEQMDVAKAKKAKLDSLEQDARIEEEINGLLDGKDDD
ncbi:chromatin DNA-binding EKC/KEOPS complex subunit GON7 KNAG_0C02290 [Huiozyma naganishii CBS 8797]|uniref:EKC/KEOPS complex subunit GON7 n=1 Tax=Huiozyma naganishii (strain ATCC MYA-139 / BCRC 22969 / CBS 8797 / KCTC 17520 / NBRC 10181 / NCYC 3082 / Yp74L-3) TaxID=1071383 RepID=J7R3D5_HUIN7|nr:hypothetical protein KNAG_0C02290 [Kazachstania naganishii CBS 8797]CCK69340.1 hypothetical protein KNAG_0C02290 [Kazachstania naganishii CBS 8797]